MATSMAILPRIHSHPQKLLTFTHLLLVQIRSSFPAWSPPDGLKTLLYVMKYASILTKSDEPQALSWFRLLQFQVRTEQHPEPRMQIYMLKVVKQGLSSFLEYLDFDAHRSGRYTRLTTIFTEDLLHNVSPSDICVPSTGFALTMIIGITACTEFFYAYLIQFRRRYMLFVDWNKL